MSWQLIRVFSDTSPAAAGYAASASTATGVDQYKWVRAICIVTGGTGGTTDITIQSEVCSDVWEDWARTPAVAATTTAKYAITPTGLLGVIPIGTSAEAIAAAVVLAVNTCVGGHPGHTLRLIYTAGAGTSAGAAQTTYLMGWRD
jgi:hypothetical protein